MAVGELLDEKERRTDVLVQEVVHMLGGDVPEPAVSAARMVGDEDVERAEGVLCGLHDAGGRRRIGEVGLHERNADCTRRSPCHPARRPTAWRRRAPTSPGRTPRDRPRAGAA